MIDKTENSLDIFEKVVELIDRKEDFAFVLVLNAEGSTPRKAGTRAIITNTGEIYGTIGGGAVESETQRRAVESCKSGKQKVFDFEFYGQDREDDIPICGGKMRILIDPVIQKYKDCIKQLTEAVKNRKKGILLSVINYEKNLKINYEWVSGDSFHTDSKYPNIDKMKMCLENEQPELFVEKVPDSEILKEIFVEPIVPKPLLVIAGGGHIGQALAIQADLVGFDILVLDDRPEFTSPKYFPEKTTTLCCDIAQQLTKIPTEKDTYIVIVTRGHKDDAQALEVCINKPFKYIGMIGSKRKVALIRENFIQSGLCSEEQFDQIFSPIGLNIGALTVPEIAASITAELIAVRRSGITHKPWKDEGSL